MGKQRFGVKWLSGPLSATNHCLSCWPWRSFLPSAEETNTEPPHSAMIAAHTVYGLHAVAIGLGIVGSSTVIGGFIGSVPSITAVILSNVKCSAARGSWAASHFRWQIRTFRYALLWMLVAVLLIVSLIGAPVGLGVLIIVWVANSYSGGYMCLSLGVIGLCY
jgi:uncharacterized membrane protein